MKNILIILVVLCLVGCMEINSSDEPSGYCYVVSGLYLTHGDVWPKRGHVENIFDTYNTDPTLKLWRIKNPSYKKLWKYQDDNCRVVITYWNKTDYHSRPLETHEKVNFKIEEAHIAYYIDANDTEITDNTP